MGFKTGKNGLLKRIAKPQLTRKQKRVFEITKKFQSSIDEADRQKTVITRRDGVVVNVQTTETQKYNVQPKQVKIKGKKQNLSLAKIDENGKIVGYEFPEPSSRVKLNRNKENKQKLLITPVSYVKPNVPRCPKCNGPMRKREPKPDQKWNAFLGCVDYPSCKGTREI